MRIALRLKVNGGKKRMIPLSLFESNVEQGITLAERPPEESTVSKADTILFLKSYKKSKREADFLKDKLKDLEAALVLPKGLSITEIGHIDGGRFLSPGEGYAAYLDLQSKYLAALAHAENICKQVIDTINLLPNEEYIYLLREYYCTDKYVKLKDLADGMNYTYDWIRHLFSRAVREIQKSLQKMQEDTQKHIRP